jgi:hypothetical protein
MTPERWLIGGADPTWGESPAAADEERHTGDPEHGSRLES